MNDPYVYPDTDILVNHFDIRDEARLGRIERLVTVEAMVELMRNPPAGMVFDFSTFLDIHRALFQDIYPFAGQVRTVEISKPEGVLSGRSARYGHPSDIGVIAHAAITTLQGVDYDAMSGPRGWQVFAEGLATLWRAHSFREGNTRAVLVFADLLLKSRGCQIDFSVMSRVPADTRDELVRASEGYGRGLADLFAEARASFVRRDNPVFGFLSPAASTALAEVSAGRDVPSRLADPGEAVRGSVLFESSGLVAIQTSRGLVGVPSSSFDIVPQTGERVMLVADAPAEMPRAAGDFEIHRRIRNAILAAPSGIGVPDGSEEFLTFRFENEDLRSIASARPDVVSRIASQVLQSNDPGTWEEWVNGRYAPARLPSP